MASAQQIVDPGVDVPSGPLAERGMRPYVRYLLLACIIPLIGFVTAFPLVSSRSYEQWSESQWGPELEFPYAQGTPDADVVIFGDSSAFLGIDPRILNAELGIQSVVLPSTVGSLPVIGDAPLRAYLAHHRQPKLIVLYFSPWNLDFQHAAEARLFEGEEMMMRHASGAEIAHYALRHPLEMTEFPLRVYSTFGPKMVMAILHHQSRTQDIAAELGHAPYVAKFGPLSDLCELPSSLLKQRGEQSVAELKQRYGVQGTQIMVYLAPVPRCVNSAPLSHMSSPDLDAAAPRLLSPTYFAADPYYAHIRPASVPEATQSFAEALKDHLQQTDPELLHIHPFASGPSGAETR